MPWWGYVLIGVGVVAIAVLKLKVFGAIQKRKTDKSHKKAGNLDHED